MAIGRYGDNIINVAKVVEAGHRSEKEPAITQHLPAVVDNVRVLLNNQNSATHKHALVKNNNKINLVRLLVMV